MSRSGSRMNRHAADWSGWGSAGSRKRIGFAILIAGLLSAPPSNAQPVVPPGVMRTPDGPLQHSLEEQKAAFDQSQRCISENSAAYQLHAATRDLLEIRDNPRLVELEFARNPSMRTRFPGGYGEMVAAAFKRYRDAGGEARSVENVTRGVDPCPVRKPFAK